MSPQLLMVLWSFFSAVSTLVFVVVLALLWPRKHVPIVGFLWLFLAAVGLRDGLTAGMLIAAATDLLPDDIGWLQLVFLGGQFFTTLPALMLAGFALHIVPAGMVTWLFRPPVEDGFSSGEAG